MRFDVITLFPEMFSGLTGCGVVGAAIRAGSIGLHCWNPRRHGRGAHQAVDDRPYGGGPGMVLQYQPLAATVRDVGDTAPQAGVPYWVVLSPQGKPLDRACVHRLAEKPRVGLVCGRYEGIDERFIEAYADEELSLGDFVLSGGEIAAMAVIDACARWQPGVLGHEDSVVEDSFEDGLLDHPHYSRPAIVDGRAVPDVLTLGDHAKIDEWRLEQRLRRTLSRRPDLMAGRVLAAAEARLLDKGTVRRHIAVPGETGVKDQ